VIELLQVVIKDFTSKVIISQFRAHTSPISALCFDPSGTLLVTASVHGHNINVFRIMPTCTANGSGAKPYDWAASHVHLYKLYRGMTAAVCIRISLEVFLESVMVFHLINYLIILCRSYRTFVLVISASGYLLFHHVALVTFLHYLLLGVMLVYSHKILTAMGHLLPPVSQGHGGQNHHFLWINSFIKCRPQ
jgi:WD40 repeat protein